MLEIRVDSLDQLAKRFFAGAINLDDEARKYTRPEICEFLRRSVAGLKEEVANLSEIQLGYRPPGTPTGVDAGGDEEHFNPAELVTHTASGLSFHQWGMTRALRHERPQFTRPPEGTKSTGTKGNVMGSGGWSGMSAPELAALLQEASERFLAYVEGLPQDIDENATARFATLGNLTAHGWLFLAAMHPALHLHQLRLMKQNPDFPAS